MLSHFLEDSDTLSAKYINFTHHRKTHMPDGYYLGLKMFDHDINQNWKIDIWILAPHDFQKSRTFMEQIHSKLTDEKKEKITGLKFKLMGRSDRPPSQSSYHLYQAVSLEEIAHEDEIINFLRLKGVQC